MSMVTTSAETPNWMPTPKAGVTKEPAFARIARICKQKLDKIEHTPKESSLDTFKVRVAQKLESAELEIKQMCSSSLEQETVRSQQSLARLDAIATRDRSARVALSDRVDVVQAKDEQQVDDLMARLDALEIASKKRMKTTQEAIKAAARGDEESLCELTSLIENRLSFFSSTISEFEKTVRMQIAALEKEYQVKLGAVRNGLAHLHQGIVLLEEHLKCVKAQQNSVSRQIDVVGRLEQAIQQRITEVKLAIEEVRERKESAKQMRIIGTIACVAFGGLAACAYASGTAVGVAAGDAMMLGGIEIKFGISLATGGAAILGSQLGNSSSDEKESGFNHYQEIQAKQKNEAIQYKSSSYGFSKASDPSEPVEQFIDRWNKRAENLPAHQRRECVQHVDQMARGTFEHLLQRRQCLTPSQLREEAELSIRSADKLVEPFCTNQQQIVQKKTVVAIPHYHVEDKIKDLSIEVFVGEIAHRIDHRFGKGPARTFEVTASSIHQAQPDYPLSPVRDKIIGGVAHLAILELMAMIVPQRVPAYLIIAGIEGLGEIANVSQSGVQRFLDAHSREEYLNDVPPFYEGRMS